MTDDLIERLREAFTFTEENHVAAQKEREEAADEIQRLTEENELWKKEAEGQQEAFKTAMEKYQAAEIERLTAERTALHKAILKNDEITRNAAIEEAAQVVLGLGADMEINGVFSGKAVAQQIRALKEKDDG